MLQTEAQKKTLNTFVYMKADDETNCRTWTGEAKLLLLILNNKQNEPRIYI